MPDRAQRHDDHHRCEQIVGCASSNQPLDQCSDQRRGDRGRSPVRAANGEGQRAPRGNDGRSDSAGQEGGGNAIGDPRRKRRGEDESGEGEAVGHGHDAGDEAGEQVPCGLGENICCCRLAAGNAVDGHSDAPLRPRRLIDPDDSFLTPGDLSR